MGVTLRRAAYLLLFVSAFGPFLVSLHTPAPSDWRFDMTAAARLGNAADNEPPFQRQFITEARPAPFVHAPALVETRNGDLLAVWYAGTREGRRDVRLFAARRRQGRATWDEPWTLIDRRSIQASLMRFVQTIGNPVLGRDRDGRIWLFFVTTSSGWSGGQVDCVVSADDGATWSAPKALVTSPVWNIGTLTKGVPFLYQDGSLGLPLYHMLMHNLSALARVGPNGVVVDTTRIAWLKQAIQPVIVPLDERRALALHRQESPEPRHVLLARTADGGRTWSSVEPLPLPNPSSAVAAVRTDSGGVLLAFNNSGRDRRNLSLALSNDEGASWRILTEIDHIGLDMSAARDALSDNISYPYMIRSANGTYQLVYAYGSSYIRSVSFTAAWLDRLVQ